MIEVGPRSLVGPILMSHSTPCLTRLRRTSLITLGCALSFASVPLLSLNAADAPASSAKMDKAAALPLTATFEKIAGAEEGPYSLKLKNTSKETLTVSAKILLSVAFHAESKARMIPEHAIKPGESYSIPGLVAEDKVTVMAKGFAPLELVVK